MFVAILSLTIIIKVAIFFDVIASNNNLPVKCSEIGHIGNYWTGSAADCNGIFYYDETAVTSNNKVGIYDQLPTDNPPEGTFNANNLKAQDTFEIIVDRKGKIIHISPAGWAHLSDSVQSPD